MQALAVSITGSVAGSRTGCTCRCGTAGGPPNRASRGVAADHRRGDGRRATGRARRDSALGTVIHLAIAHDNPTEVDPVQVLFDPVDVSGDSAVVFAVLRPQGSHVEVGIIAVADVPLSPLGSAARSSARQVIGRGPAQSDEVGRGGAGRLGIDAAVVRRRQRGRGHRHRGRRRRGGRHSQCRRRCSSGRRSRRW